MLVKVVFDDYNIKAGLGRATTMKEGLLAKINALLYPCINIPKH